MDHSLTPLTAYPLHTHDEVSSSANALGQNPVAKLVADIGELQLGGSKHLASCNNAKLALHKKLASIKCEVTEYTTS